MKRDPGSKSVSIHRLIQTQYRARMSRDEAIGLFKLATGLMFSAFPKQRNGLSLRNNAEICQSLIQHVMALCSSYEELAKSCCIDFELAEFTKLLSSASWWVFLKCLFYETCG